MRDLTDTLEKSPIRFYLLNINNLQASEDFPIRTSVTLR